MVNSGIGSKFKLGGTQAFSGTSGYGKGPLKYYMDRALFILYKMLGPHAPGFLRP